MTRIEAQALDNDTSYGNCVELEGNSVLTTDPDGQERFWVHVTPDAGVASFGFSHRHEPHRFPRRDEPLPQTIAAANRRARSQLRKHAVAASLQLCLTLTYATEPEDPRADADEFLEYASKFYEGKFHWAVVTVLKEETGHRTHHHLLLPPNLSIHKIASGWGRGIVHIGINPSQQDIRKMVNYVAQDFPPVRPSGQRVRRSRGSFRPSVKFRVGSLEEARGLALSIAGASSGSMGSLNTHSSGRGVIYWDVPSET